MRDDYIRYYVKLVKKPNPPKCSSCNRSFDGPGKPETIESNNIVKIRINKNRIWLWLWASHAPDYMLSTKKWQLEKIEFVDDAWYEKNKETP